MHSYLNNDLSDLFSFPTRFVGSTSIRTGSSCEKAVREFWTRPAGVQE